LQGRNAFEGIRFSLDLISHLIFRVRSVDAPLALAADSATEHRQDAPGGLTAHLSATYAGVPELFRKTVR
jgi:hypothetical protein